VGELPAKFGLQKYETDINYTTKAGKRYFGFISVVPGSDLFFCFDRLPCSLVKFGNSDNTNGSTLLEDPAYNQTDTFRYPNIDIHMWNADQLYRSSG
jgi:hypothetical protein